MKIKTITESLHDKYVNGEITLRQAAENFASVDGLMVLSTWKEPQNL